MIRPLFGAKTRDFANFGEKYFTILFFRAKMKQHQKLEVIYMFCPKCGTQLPDGSGFCTSCGNKIGGGAPAPRPRAPREAFKRPGYRELLSLAFATIVFIFLLLPTLSNGISIVAAEVFDFHAMFGVGKIFMILAAVVYLCYVAISFIDLGLPVAVRRLAPLCFYGLTLFAQLFVFIGCIIVKGVTMGATWYLMLVVLAFATVYELVPKLFKLDK